MSKTIGIQYRETLEESGYTVLEIHDGYVHLMDEIGKVELWQENDDFAGYVIDIGGIGYEFVRSL